MSFYVFSFLAIVTAVMLLNVSGFGLVATGLGQALFFLLLIFLIVSLVAEIIARQQR